jgi:MinD superfamily P-loop ATPase
MVVLCAWPNYQCWVYRASGVCWAALVFASVNPSMCECCKRCTYLCNEAMIAPSDLHLMQQNQIILEATTIGATALIGSEPV